MSTRRSRMSAGLSLGCALCAGLLAALALHPEALFGAVMPATAVQSPDSLEELAARATQAVVLIDVETASDKRQGSGFLVDAEGRILTNNHVIRDARSVRIKLASGDIYDAVTVLSTDERRDLAVLGIAGFNLPFLPLGNSDSVRIGHPVVVIGSPLGLENTVTTGIVSGRRQEAEGYQVLQISAPASRGSSGGPVLSRNGEVVGIAASQMQVGQNLNFAVPINYARGLLAHIGGDPIAVLRPSPTVTEDVTVPMALTGGGVNQGLTFSLSTFGGYSAEFQTVGRDRPTQRRTRITYRRIETVGNGEPRIERYLESETSQGTGPFNTEQTVRRERIRTIVRVSDLQPISTRGEIARWTGEEWERSEYDLRFDGYRVRGLIRDSSGRAEELDRELPRGIVLREMRDLAFATLSSDALVGRSVELVTFDPLTGDVMNDRYDVRIKEEVEIGGKKYEAFRVNVASGLANSVVHFGTDDPHLLLSIQSEGLEVEELTGFEVFPAPTEAR